MKTISILITIILFLSSFLINLSISYKLERYVEDKDWESIETEKENVFKPVIVERRELLFFRFLRSGNTDNSSSTETVSIKFEIHSKDIQETFYLFGLNNDTSVRNIKDVEIKDRKEETTPIRIEACFDPIKPLYFSLSMFNYLWGGDLLFTIQENDPSYCINSMPNNVQKKKIEPSILIDSDVSKSETPLPTNNFSINNETPSSTTNNQQNENSTNTTNKPDTVTTTPAPTTTPTPTTSVKPENETTHLISNKQKIESNQDENEINQTFNLKPQTETSPAFENKQQIEYNTLTPSNQVIDSMKPNKQQIETN
ncbi:hypothetical protein RB653_009402 [Dictyostelium firmibasis]|uniref:Uncharacterized protein n=1 Tax=Dictyostelium firmibasis TaxID=79012 RepID=A0AAN7U1Z7_9MYCE